MDKAKFDELFYDKNVIKIATLGGEFFKDQKESIVVQFVFYHGGGCYIFPRLLDSRIAITIFPLHKLIDGINPRTIKNEILILANSETWDYALTYKITVDEEKRTVSVILQDVPEMGERFISSDELNGMTLSY